MLFFFRGNSLTRFASALTSPLITVTPGSRTETPTPGRPTGGGAGGGGGDGGGGGASDDEDYDQVRKGEEDTTRMYAAQGISGDIVSVSFSLPISGEVAGDASEAVEGAADSNRGGAGSHPQGAERTAAHKGPHHLVQVHKISICFKSFRASFDPVCSTIFYCTVVRRVAPLSFFSP